MLGHFTWPGDVGGSRGAFRATPPPKDPKWPVCPPPQTVDRVGMIFLQLKMSSYRYECCYKSLARLERLLFFSIFEIQNCEIFFRIPKYRRNWVLSQVPPVVGFFKSFFSKVNLDPSHQVGSPVPVAGSASAWHLTWLEATWSWNFHKVCGFQKRRRYASPFLCYW